MSPLILRAIVDPVARLCGLGSTCVVLRRLLFCARIHQLKQLARKALAIVRLLKRRRHAMLGLGGGER
eukprot:5401048-Pleurochrysis_carterae.AAC.1